MGIGTGDYLHPRFNPRLNARRQTLNAEEALGVRLVVGTAALHRRNRFVIETVRARATIDINVALVERERYFASRWCLRVLNEGHQRVHLRCCLLYTSDAADE